MSKESENGAKPPEQLAVFFSRDQLPEAYRVFIEQGLRIETRATLWPDENRQPIDGFNIHVISKEDEIRALFRDAQERLGWGDLRIVLVRDKFF